MPLIGLDNEEHRKENLQKSERSRLEPPIRKLIWPSERGKQEFKC